MVKPGADLPLRNLIGVDLMLSLSLSESFSERNEVRLSEVAERMGCGCCCNNAVFSSVAPAAAPAALTGRLSNVGEFAREYPVVAVM